MATLSFLFSIRVHYVNKSIPPPSPNDYNKQKNKFGLKGMAMLYFLQEGGIYKIIELA